MNDVKIGNVTIHGNIFLAPMAGVSDMPYRALCKEQGASFTYTEMVSAKALEYKNKNTIPLIQVSKQEGQAALQLFGSDADTLANEALKLEEGPYAFFDVNMGCPMPKIVGNGDGCALMNDPKRVEEIVSKMVGKLHKPVTVKIRKGFDERSINAVEIAKIAQGAGAAAVCVHGRCREDYYSGKADWDIIGEVKAAVDIPVFGSGDIFCAKDAAEMLKRSGCDGVMAARGARGNPWIFAGIIQYMETGKEPEKPGIEEVKQMIFKHAKAEAEFFGEEIAVRKMRKHVAWYSAGYPQSARLRQEINKACTLKEFEEILTMWAAVG